MRALVPSTVNLHVQVTIPDDISLGDYFHELVDPARRISSITWTLDHRPLDLNLWDLTPREY
jgi:hypothetical protein